MCQSVRANRKNKSPLGEHQADDFPEGLNYINDVLDYLEYWTQKTKKNVEKWVQFV